MNKEVDKNDGEEGFVYLTRRSVVCRLMVGVAEMVGGGDRRLTRR